MELNKAKINFDFVLPTVIFCVVGLFIPALTAVLLFGIQVLMTKIGIECTSAWKTIWLGTWIGMIILPIFFIRYLKKSCPKNSSLKINLLLFYFLEYTFIQASFASLISNVEMLCYGTDGQNGLEFVFTAWLSLPFLFAFGFLFKYIWKSKPQKFVEIRATKSI